MPRMLRRLAIGLACAFGALAMMPAARAQSFFAYTATVDRQSDLGTVVAASAGQTVFRVSPAGSVTRVSGSGVRTTAGAAAPAMVTIGCDSSTSACRDTTIQVTLAATGTPTNRAVALTNFTIAAGTATVVSGPTGTNPVTFTISGFTPRETRTFYVGFDMAIRGDDSGVLSGQSTSSFSVVAAAVAATSGTSAGSGTALVLRNLSVAGLANMNFGRLTLPTSGTQTVSLSPVSQAVTLAGTGAGGSVWSSPAPSAAQFRISGEGGRAVSVSVPSTVTLTGPAGASAIVVTTSATASGAQTLGGTAGSAGTLDISIGGSFNVSASTVVGAYSGTISMTTQYN